MTTYRITKARSKKNIGKTFTVQNGQTVFNKKAYDFNFIVLPDGTHCNYSLTLVSHRITPDIRIEIEEIK